MRKRPRVLIIGDGGVPSGFARVIRSVFGRLSTRYDLHHLALGYRGDPHDEKWRMYPAGALGDPLGVNRLEPLVRLLTPDLVFAIHEPGVIARWVRVLKRLLPPSRIVAYMAIEAGPLPAHVVEDMHGARWVTYTEFARRQIVAAGGVEANVAVIPHGVDTDAFHPHPKPRDARLTAARRGRARRALNLPRDRDTFIVLNANRNQVRKGVDVTIAGFAGFAANKPPGVKLYLHMGRRDVGWDLDELVRRHRISDRVIYATADPGPPRVPDAHLNLVYNACDVGLNTALCEGWGMVSFEHAATGAAQLVPRHTACRELWRDAAVMLEPAVSYIHPPSLEEVFVTSAASVTSGLEELYRDRAALARWRDAAYRRATQPEFSWQAIATEWHTILRRQLVT